MWIILLLVSAYFTTATGQLYFFSNNSSSSTKAPQLCTLATPSIKFKQDGQEIYQTSGIPEIITDNIWVGFVNTSSTFVYKGCADGDLITNPNSTDAIRADIGKCYSFCGTTFIGISMKDNGKSRCHCLKHLPLVLNVTDCSVACTYPSDTLCGNSNRNKEYVSVYEQVSEPNTRKSEYPDDIGGRCLAFEPTNHYLFWGQCSKPFRRICQDGNGVMTHLNEVYANWKTSMQDCIRHRQFPVDHRIALASLQLSGGPLWFGAVKGCSIFTLSDALRNTKESYEQGYIDKMWNLQFDSSLKLRSLCMINISHDLTSSTLGTEMSTQPSSPPSTSSPPKTTRNSTSAISNTIPSSTENLMQPSIVPPTSSPTNNTRTSTSASGGSETIQSDESKGGGIVALYVVVPLLVIAIAVAIGFVIWRRRRKLPQKDSHPPENSSISPHNGSIPLKGATLSQDDSTYKQADSTLRHDYLILEPVNEYAAIKDTDLDNNDNEDYDTTEGATRRNISDNDTGNIYNHLDDVSEGTYNHTNTVNIRVDDTYNHTGYCGDETTYNTAESLSRSKKGTGTVNSENRQANDVNDTYNHIHVA